MAPGDESDLHLVDYLRTSILSNQQTVDFAQGSLVAASIEVAEAGELREAAFCIIKAAQPAGSRARPYHEQYLRWLKQGVGSGEAYTQRAAIHNAAHCYLQVCCDCPPLWRSSSASKGA